MLAALIHPGHIAIYASGIYSFSAAMHLEIHRVYIRRLFGWLLSSEYMVYRQRIR
ncbi:hypothetical protein XIS1_1040015 [Xenorhabdus innexi]|uniref:Uncharacterized protein n=1 Tax=Xenorhabdus innexi TaxID=290109 RepID=A0A1N6MQ96_9GAMM|nr:hypothetical protein XIS1_1040015 [Xenorhabdus innexi]